MWPVRDAWTSLLHREPWLALDLVRRVERGMALLDAHDPGWFMRVDPRALDQSTARRDVLGQLHGDSEQGCRILRSTLPGDVLFSAADHGFTLREGEHRVLDPAVPARHAALTALWRREVVARRVAAAARTTTITVRCEETRC